MKKKSYFGSNFGSIDDPEKFEMDEKKTTTAFIMMFPTLMLAGMAVLFADELWAKFLGIALCVYQFLMLKKFIEDYYHK